MLLFGLVLSIARIIYCRIRKRRFFQSLIISDIIILVCVLVVLELYSDFPSTNASYEEEYRVAWYAASVIEVQIGSLEGQWDEQIVTKEMLLEYHELKSLEEELRARMREIKNIMETKAKFRRLVLYPFIK